MGRRKNRKKERRQENRGGWNEPAPTLFVPDKDEFDDMIMAFESQRSARMAPPVPMCGGCKEFIEDEHGGRGTCLHPGSGILSPWTDTPGCPFFGRRR